MNAPVKSPQEKTKDYLNYLAIGHYVLGGLTMLFSCMFLMHLGMGLMMLFNPNAFSHEADEAHMIGMLFTGIGATCIVLGWGLGIAMIYAGRCMAARRKHLFCTIVAAVDCLLMPLGTILGILALVVLLKDDTKAMFN